MVGEGEGAQCEKEAQEEEVYRSKRSVVVRHAQPAHSHAQIEIDEQGEEKLDDERIKVIVDKFKQNVENNAETNVTTQRCDVSAAADPLLPLLRMLLPLLRMLLLVSFGFHGSLMVRSFTITSCFKGLREIQKTTHWLRFAPIVKRYFLPVTHSIWD